MDANALHRAAERVAHEAGTPAMDALAAAGAEFIRTSDYGVMLGYLAALEEARVGG